MEFVDTHCHIHEAQYELQGDNTVRAAWLRANKPDADVMITEAVEDGVTRMLCVGTSVEDSELAVDFVQTRAHTWASVGIHPHEAQNNVDDIEKLRIFSNLITKGSKIVAIGECGLDYYYKHSPSDDQKRLLRFQIELALEHSLPLIFHVRDAFDDFWPIFDSYKGLRGVLHSFTANSAVLDKALARGLYIGLNGIMTFTKEHEQLKAAKAVPQARLLLETDAPFLTPVPFRGKICQPKHICVTAEFLAQLRGETLSAVAKASTTNAKELFNLS